MSTSSPQPSQTPGALEEASSPKSRVRITVLTILALHVVVIGGLLLQGCDKRPTRATGPTNSVSSLPPLNTDTNFYGGFPGDAGAGGSRPSAGAPAGATGATGVTADPGGIPPVGLASSPGGVPSSTSAPAAGSSPLAGSPGAGTAGAGSPGQGASPSYNTLPPAGSQPFAPIATPPPAAGPVAPTSEHTIKAGENIGLLAKKYHVTEKAIFDANPQVKPRNLKIGDKLIIPAAAPATGSTASTAGGEPAGAGTGRGATAAPAASAGGEEVYIVKQGDTLAKIAKKFGVTVKALRAANGLKGDRIVAKQRLTIPAKAPAAVAAPAGGASRPGGA